MSWRRWTPRSPRSSRTEGRASVEVEDVVEERTLLPASVPIVVIVVTRALAIAVAVIVPVPITIVSNRCRRGSSADDRRRGALDDLVQFTAIEPDTAALRAMVDFDAFTTRDR